MNVSDENFSHYTIHMRFSWLPLRKPVQGQLGVASLKKNRQAAEEMANHLILVLSGGPGKTLAKAFNEPYRCLMESTKDFNWHRLKN